jgi:eukaryotic-like serine/threonine-protein kinase
MLDFREIGEPQVHNGNRTIRFSSFEVDLGLGEVRKAGTRVRLQDQPFRVLKILLEHPGELVTREELQSRIWPDESFGDFDHAVNVAVGKLRAALGDSAEAPSFIETLPRRGYRFVAKLEDATASGTGSHGPSLGSLSSGQPAINARPRATWVGRHPAFAGLAVILVAGILVSSGVLLGGRRHSSSPPEFYRLTVDRGSVYAARFAPDGENVVYAASWDGAPVEIFSTDPKLPGARSIGLKATDLLAMSSMGEIAILQPPNHRFLMTFRGTLGQVPLAGGSPRQLAENVEWADWTPDGSALVIVHAMGGQERIEFPIGHVLYQTSGWVSHLRVSPKGNQIAFLDHPFFADDQGNVAVVDLAGHKKILSTGWESVEGLAWFAQGDEIWFSAASSGPERSIYAVDLRGRQRQIFRAPGGVTLEDISATGRILLTRDDQRAGMMALPPGATSETPKQRELSWQDWSLSTDISKDGNNVLFDEQGIGSGPSYVVAMRDTSGSPPIRLGEGVAETLSPDGKWAITLIGYSRLVLLPTGVGIAKEVAKGEIERYWHGAYWMPDGKQIIFAANLPGHGVQCFVQSVDGGKPRSLTGEGVSVCEISPDGRVFIGYQAGVGANLYTLDGTPPHSIPGLLPGESFEWTSDPRFMYVYQGKQVPVRIYRLDIASGQRRFFREIAPSDVAGLSDISHIHFSSDGRAYVYSYTRLLSDLYLVNGLR